MKHIAKNTPASDYTRMEGIRTSGAAGVHADQNARKSNEIKRRQTRREERNAKYARYDD